MRISLVFLLVVVLIYPAVQTTLQPSTDVVKVEERFQVLDTFKLIADLQRGDMASLILRAINLLKTTMNPPWYFSIVLTIIVWIVTVIRPFFWLVFSSTKPEDVEGFGFNTIWQNDS